MTIRCQSFADRGDDATFDLARDAIFTYLPIECAAIFSRRRYFGVDLILMRVGANSSRERIPTSCRDGRHRRRRP